MRPPSLALGAGSASAATIVVGITQDAPNGGLDDLGCTLRDAIDSANQNKSIANGCNGDNAGADTIILQGGKTYRLSLHAVDENNAKGDLDITGPVTIRSAGPGLATIDAASNTFPGPPPPRTWPDPTALLPTTSLLTMPGFDPFRMRCNGDCCNAPTGC